MNEPEVIVCGDTIKVRPRGALLARRRKAAVQQQLARVQQALAEAEAYRQERDAAYVRARDEEYAQVIAMWLVPFQ